MPANVNGVRNFEIAPSLDLTTAQPSYNFLQATHKKHPMAPHLRASYGINFVGYVRTLTPEEGISGIDT